VTEALLRRGVPEDRLVLVEFNPDFVTLLRQRFRRATIIQGDAYRLHDMLGEVLPAPASAVVSSLPLLTKPPGQRLALLQEAFGLMQPGGPFVQFTYSVAPPIPERGSGYESVASNWIFLNIPPARVWVYRQT
jgi:phosphatidylethanolamine/phosphatidyl-N-methylethanolamine N-methyltransferase